MADNLRCRGQEEFIGKAAKCASLLIAGAIFGCVVTLLYFLYYYHWTHERSFTSALGLLLCYLLPATLAGFLLASLRLKPSYRINLSLLLCSTGASLFIVELLLTFSTSMLSRGAADIAKIAKDFGVVFDTRSISDILVELEKQHIHAVPNSAPSLLLKAGRDSTLQSEITINGSEILPLGGIANKVVVFCNESGEYVTYESDEHGFHNPKGLWDAVHVDIAALGDSFTQGYCVPSNTNFVALIRKQYPATLNLGMQANGPLAELATLKEYLPAIKPTIVLWFYFEGNDLTDLMREKGSPLLMAYLRNNFTQGLLHQQAAIDQALTTYVAARRNANTPKEWGAREDTDRGASGLPEALQALIKLTYIRQHLGLTLGRSPQDNPQGEMDLDLDLFGEILSRAKTLVSAWGGTLEFVYLPAWARYATPESVNRYSDRALYWASLRSRDRVLALVRTLGCPVIDIYGVFQAHSDPLALFPFRQRTHYNEGGTRLVAEEVLRSLLPADLQRHTRSVIPNNPIGAIALR